MKAMEQWQKQWHILLGKIDRLSRRERIQMIITMLVVLGGTWSQLILDPYHKERVELLRQQAQLETDTQEMNRLASDVLARKDKNPDQFQQEQIARFKQEIAQLDKQLGTGILGMVSPTEMISALKELLSKSQGLTLLNLQAPAPINLLKGNDADGAVYQHTLILRFAGAFPDVLTYLQDLEQLPWKLFWDSVQFVVIEHPKAFVTLEIHTLSLSFDLLGADAQ